jgi:putative SOS response-associated peptidase YedK
MCGRFALTATGDTMAELFQLLKPPDWSPRYNIAPTQPIPVIRKQVGGGRYCSLLRWGLVPSWSREIKGPPLINARAEGIADKPAFRTALCQRRCLVPADSFYEWRGQGRKKQAFNIRLRDQKLFAFAGLWDRWHGGDEPLESCTIVTTEANALVQPLHDRMPVILPSQYWDEWLDPDMCDPDRTVSLLQPYPADAMTAIAVGDWVGNVRNDDVRCLEPAGYAREGSLFDGDETNSSAEK